MISTRWQSSLVRMKKTEWDWWYSLHLSLEWQSRDPIQQLLKHRGRLTTTPWPLLDQTKHWMQSDVENVRSQHVKNLESRKVIIEIIKANNMNHLKLIGDLKRIAVRIKTHCLMAMTHHFWSKFLHLSFCLIEFTIGTFSLVIIFNLKVKIMSCAGMYISSQKNHQGACILKKPYNHATFFNWSFKGIVDSWWLLPYLGIHVEQLASGATVQDHWSTHAYRESTTNDIIYYVREIKSCIKQPVQRNQDIVESITFVFKFQSWCLY